MQAKQTNAIKVHRNDLLIFSLAKRAAGLLLPATQKVREAA